MGRETCKRLSILIIAVAILLFGTCALTDAAQTPAPDGSASTSLASGNSVQERFHEARESFLKKDFKGAASDIRQAAASIRDESAKATGAAKTDLAGSATELDQLADRVEKKAVTSEKELNDTFARAHYALARYYHTAASESRAKKETRQSGQYLKAAAIHVENALASAGERIEEKSKKVIREAKDVGEKMEKDVAQSTSEVGKSLEAIGREIEQAAHKIPFPRSTAVTSIQMAARPTGSVDLSTAIVKVAKEAMPKVVYIEVTQSSMVQNPLLPFENDPFFRRFFGIPKMPRKFKQEMKGLGSGVLIDAQGHILTNYHVAGAATKIQVTLADGSQYPATLVGADQKTDLAVVKIAAKESLPYVAFGDSDKVEVGEWVVAIGAPRALEKSATQGIISAMHRTGITDPNTYQDFLQTDAPINPGNSGGPLLNLYGQVIGINAAIATESGGFEGIGFTIPSNMAVYIANALIAHGKVERGWLGVSIQNLTRELATAAHVETLAGALIVDVVKGGPADKAGLKKNDVVIAYGGKEIPDSSTLRNAVAQTPIGQKVTLTILRAGRKETVTITVGNLEESTKLMAAVVKERLGAEVRAPSPNEVEHYGLNANQGVVISWLDPKGPLATAGFEVDDMILAINQQPVEGVEIFITMVSALPSGQRASFTAFDHRTGNTGNILVMVK